MVYSALYINKKTVVHFSRFLPIAVNFLFTVNKKIDWRVKLALFSSLCADWCFLFIKNLNVGIVFYQLVQLEYYVAMGGSHFDLLGALVLINIMWAITLKRELVGGTLCYVFLTAINLVKSMKSPILKIGVRLLAFCDSCILFKMAFKKHKFLNRLFDLLEWMAYIPSQLCTVLYGLKKSHAF